jgi:hypothetical protein
VVFGWRALRPPRVVFVIGCVYVLQHRCGRVQAEFTSKLTLLSGSIASGEFRKHRSRMVPQDPSALQTLDFIDSINPALPSGPQARQPRTAPRGLEAASMCLVAEHCLRRCHAHGRDGVVPGGEARVMAAVVVRVVARVVPGEVDGLAVLCELDEGWLGLREVQAELALHRGAPHTLRRGDFGACGADNRHDNGCLPPGRTACLPCRL